MALGNAVVPHIPTLLGNAILRRVWQVSGRDTPHDTHADDTNEQHQTRAEQHHG